MGDSDIVHSERAREVAVLYQSGDFRTGDFRTIAKYAKPPYNERVVSGSPAMLGPVAQVARARP